jgi:hypothetical protein
MHAICFAVGHEPSLNASDARFVFRPWLSRSYSAFYFRYGPAHPSPQHPLPQIFDYGTGHWFSLLTCASSLYLALYLSHPASLSVLLDLSPSFVSLSSSHSPHFSLEQTHNPPIATMAPRQADSKVDVLIIGAGPAGLMMANWMSRCGIKTRIVDKRGTKVSTFIHL